MNFCTQITAIKIQFFSSLKCPVLVAWGDKDPWEPIELGRAYSNFDSVEDFIVLPDVGHCPQVSLSLSLSVISMQVKYTTDTICRDHEFSGRKLNY